MNKKCKGKCYCGRPIFVLGGTPVICKCQWDKIKQNLIDGKELDDGIEIKNPL